jgi:hypothetical protein
MDPHHPGSPAGEQVVGDGSIDIAIQEKGILKSRVSEATV